MKTHVLRFRMADKGTFDAIHDGVKKVETRAATERYAGIVAGDTLRFVCGRRSFVRRVTHVHRFPSVEALLKKYAVGDIHPGLAHAHELQAMYDSFPEYPEKIKKFGLIALELAAK